MKQYLLQHIFVTFCLLAMESRPIPVLADKDCISTLYEFQKSLVNRSVNLDSLRLAFSPANHQASISITVYYHFCSRILTINSTSKILCNDIENWANDINSGRSPTVDYTGDKYAHKFEWNASPINLFIRPYLLANLSLYTFQISTPTTHLILDQLCEDVINPEPNTDFMESPPKINISVCLHPPPVLILLQELTVDLRSFHLHKESFFVQGTKADGNELGYPTYYFVPDNHTQDKHAVSTDVCVLTQYEAYKERRLILLIAIILTQIIIPLMIPFTGRFFYRRIKNRLAGEDATPNTLLYFGGFIMTMLILCLLILVNDITLLVTTLIRNPHLWSSIPDVHINYIVGIALFAMQLFLSSVSVIFNAWQKNGGSCTLKDICYQGCCKSCTFGWSVWILVCTLALASVHIVFIFMAFIAAPIEVGSLVSLYLTALFVLTMLFTLILKGCIVTTGVSVEEFKERMEKFVRKKFTRQSQPQQEGDLEAQRRQQEREPLIPNNQQERDKQKCCRVFDMSVVWILSLLVLVDLGLYLVFYYKMAITVEPYTSQAGFLQSFGTLFPAIFASIIGFLAKNFITFVTVSAQKPTTPAAAEPPGPIDNPGVGGRAAEVNQRVSINV